MPEPRSSGTSRGEAESHFRPDIEGLRAVAILLVILYHIGWRIIGGGYVGVDIFFVISGFLITSQLYRELDRKKTISIVSFYARRITRLLPAATLTIVVTAAAAWVWLPPTRFRSIALDGLCAGLYGINYRLASAGIDYLGADAPPSPLQNFWSLAVEEQFYLVWPVLLLIVATLWRVPRRWRGRTPSRGVLVVLLVAIASGSFTLSVVQTENAAPWAFFGAPARAWELAVGAMVALAVPVLARRGRVFSWVSGAAGFAAIMVSGVLYRDTMAFPGSLAAMPVLGAAAVIAAGCQRRYWTPVAWLLSRSPLQRIGKLSYSWYLWHWPVLLIVPVVVGLPSNLGWNLLLAAWALALAAVTHAIVETPIRFQPSLRARPWRSIALGCALSVSVSIAAAIAVQLPMRQIVVGSEARAAANLTGTAGNAGTTAQAGNVGNAGNVGKSDSDIVKELARVIEASAQEKTVPSNLNPRLDLATRDFPALYADKCDPPLTSSQIRDTCVYGDTASTKVVVLFGDSHAAQWFSALDVIAREQHWKLIPYVKNACSAASVLIQLKELKREYTECVQWRVNALDRIRSLRPSMVVMSSNGDGGMPVGGSGDADRAWMDGWVRTMDQLKPLTGRLVMIADTPWPTGNVPDCLSIHADDIGVCVRPAAQAVAKPRRRAMVMDAAKRENVPVIDPITWFCTSKVCPVIIGNTLVYRDGSHISAAYSTMLAPVLWESLR